MNKCKGGIEIDGGPCSKCGAWPSDACGFPLPEFELAHLRAENKRLREQLAEARRLLDKVVVNDEWLAAPEWQDACNKLLEALAGEEE